MSFLNLLNEPICKMCFCPDKNYLAQHIAGGKTVATPVLEFGQKFKSGLVPKSGSGVLGVLNDDTHSKAGSPNDQDAR